MKLSNAATEPPVDPKAQQFSIPAHRFLSFRLHLVPARALILLSVLLTASTLFAASPVRSVPGRILIKARSNASETNLIARLKQHGASNIQALRNLNIRAITTSEDRIEWLLTALRADPEIEYAERDYIAHAAFEPNDPWFTTGAQWHLNRIQAPSAWDITVGLTNTLVAVLDSGIQAAHPDLAGQLVSGYDFVNGDADPADDFGHGTAVAGVIIASGNNGAGIAGIAYGCRVLPVKVMDSAGFATYSAIAQGIRYAVDRGARVINISIVGSSASATLQEAVDYAWSRNVLVIAAAGNFANNVPQYPAACQRVIAVSAISANDAFASFSSYGDHVMFSAPGDQIWTTQRDLNNPYAAWRGTSFASPVVAAVAALAASANPTLSNDALLDLLQQTADDMGPFGRDPWFGIGRVNAARAALAASLQPGGHAPGPGTSQPQADDIDTTPPPGEDDIVTFAALTVLTNGVGKVTPNLDGRILQVGKSYSMKAVPAAGQAFAGWNGDPALPAALTFTMEPGLVLTAEFVPTPFPVLKGAYAGLMFNTNGVDPDSSGFFNISVTSSGQFTGKLLTAGKRRGFRGQLDITGRGVVTVKRGQLPPIELALQFDMSGTTDEVKGTVAGAGWAAELSGDRNVFNAKENPAAQAGSRAFILERAEDANAVAGTGASTISNTGKARVKGKLENGKVFSAGSLLARNGDCPVYIPFNKGAEVVIGWINFPETATPSATGTVIWISSGTNAFAATLHASSAP